MNRQQRRNPAFKKAFEAEQAKQSDRLTPVPKELWPRQQCEGARVVEVWRSKTFLAVVYVEREMFTRLTVNRASLGKGGWAAEITWDELQKIKHEIGRGEQWAVEMFPADSDLVNVANMRHLWLLDDPPMLGWHKPKTIMEQQ